MRQTKKDLEQKLSRATEQLKAKSTALQAAIGERDKAIMDKITAESELAQQQKLNNSLDEARREWKEAYEQEKKERGLIGALHENEKSRAEALDKQLADALQERDDWKAEYLKMHEKMRMFRIHFYQQASLAGKLADNA
jgi:hypothetical protein